MPKAVQAAQSQHYVPKFILRQFLSDERKEHVSVFRKSTQKGFTASIDKVMAERRFHDFAIGDNYIASFEESIGKIEDQLLPYYRQVLDERQLRRVDPMQRAGLSLFTAFQMVRTRWQRDQFAKMERQLSEKLSKMGGKLSDLEGWEELTEDRLTELHIDHIKGSLHDFAQIIAAKNFLLLEAPPGRSFYLGDNPVAMHNESEPPNAIFGNIGLAVRGIQIYLPLSADLMLAAFCPTILETAKAKAGQLREGARRDMVTAMLAGQVEAAAAKNYLEYVERTLGPVEDMREQIESGLPRLLSDQNMDFCNSAQMVFARDFVVCAQGDFKLARQMMETSPNLQTGITFG